MIGLWLISVGESLGGGGGNISDTCISVNENMCIIE